LIIDGYITREVLKPLFAITFGLIVVFVGYSSGRYLAYAVDGILQVDTLASFIVVKMIIALEVLLPIALYLSIVLGLGGLESRSEITALRASGIGNGRVVRVVVQIALLMAVAVASFSIFARPAAYAKSYKLKAQAEAELELDKLASGNFYDSENRVRTIFVEEVDKANGRLSRIFIRGEHHGIIHVVSAESGQHTIDEKTGQPVLDLFNVHVYFIGAGGSPDKGVGRFKRMKLRMRDANPTSIGYKRKAAAIDDLLGSDSPYDVAELQWRLSAPLSTLLLAVLAVVLSRAAPRGSRYTKTIGALIIYAVYYNVAAMAKTWVETGVVGTSPGIWWVQCALAILIAGLLALPHWRFRRAAKQDPTPDPVTG